jgi:hypothetical protein
MVGRNEFQMWPVSVKGIVIIDGGVALLHNGCGA